jgi:hypothetical protein
VEVGVVCRLRFVFAISAVGVLVVGCGEDRAGEVSATSSTSVERAAVTSVAAGAREPCVVAAQLVEVDVALAQAEPFAFVKRDPLMVQLRGLIGELRLQAWVFDKDLYDDVFRSTTRLERADLSESGLFTEQEAAAALELSSAVDSACSLPLSTDGMLLVPPSG